MTETTWPKDPMYFLPGPSENKVLTAVFLHVALLSSSFSELLYHLQFASHNF